MTSYSINDLEKISGILAHTIRIWEKRYNIIEPSRTDTNRRRYSDADLRRIINISILNRNGYKISKIASMSDEVISEKVAILSEDSRNSDTQIESLVMSMIDFDDIRFNEIISRSVESLGFEETFTEIVFPFFRRVGILWQTGSVNPAQEHFVSNIVRQKIISNIDSLEEGGSDDNKRIIFFLPEKEIHELPLLFLTYIARSQGHSVLYLGQLTPLSALHFSIDRWKADIVVTGTLSLFSDIDSAEYVRDLASILKGRMLILAGLLANSDLGKFPTNTYTVKNAEDFARLIAGNN